MKLLLTSLSGHHYIRYIGKGFKLFVTIEVFDAPEIMQHRIRELAESLAAEGESFLGATTSLGEKYYLLNADDYEIYFPDPERAAKNIAHQMRRLADWYRFAYLIPVSRGQEPEIRQPG